MIRSHLCLKRLNVYIKTQAKLKYILRCQMNLNYVVMMANRL